VTDAFTVPKWLKIDLSGIIQILLILAMIWAGWLKFDARLKSVEDKEETDRQNEAQETVILKQLTTTLDKLNLTLQTFPLHLHLKDGEILYPGGTVANDPLFNGHR
jgi:hypothetical protein